MSELCVDRIQWPFRAAKLMYASWGGQLQVVPKYSADKKLLSEMILVCNALRNDLNHANEYVRGSMLRFLCKLKEPELLEPLVPSIKVRYSLSDE